MNGDQFFQIDKRALFFYRDFDQAGQQGRYLHHAHALFPVYRDQLHSQVQGLITQERERTGGIHRHGRQHRVHHFLIIILQPLFPFVAAFFDGFDLRSAGFFQILQYIRQDFAFQFHLLMGRLGDHPQLFPHRQSGRILTGDAVFILIPQSGYPDHEKLIQVGGGDRDKLQPFQDRRGFHFRFPQHPQVKFQPAQLPVEEILRPFQVRFADFYRFCRRGFVCRFLLHGNAGRCVFNSSFHNSRRFFYCGCRFLFGRHYIAFRFDSRFIFTFAHNDSTRSRRTLNPYTSSIINTLEAKVHSSRSRSALLTTSMVSSRLCRVTLHCWIFCI